MHSIIGALVAPIISLNNALFWVWPLDYKDVLGSAPGLPPLSTFWQSVLSIRAQLFSLNGMQNYIMRFNPFHNEHLAELLADSRAVNWDSRVQARLASPGPI